jgi:HTH-type transcriptional regulator/antitoxin HipB
MRIRTPREVGLLIRELRTRRQWSQGRLAEAIGVSRQWVAALEHGKPRAELGLTLRALNALGVTLDVLATAEGGAGGQAVAQATARVGRLAR